MTNEIIATMTPTEIEELICSPDLMIALCERVKELQARCSQLAAEVEIMQPKADYFDKLVKRNTLKSIRGTAKELQIPTKKLLRFLLDRKYLYRKEDGQLMPDESRNDGLFEVMESQTTVTPKGRETFRLLYAEP